MLVAGITQYVEERNEKQNHVGGTLKIWQIWEKESITPLETVRTIIDLKALLIVRW